MLTSYIRLFAGFIVVSHSNSAIAGELREQLSHDFRQGMPPAPLFQLVGRTPAKFVRPGPTGIHVALPAEDDKPFPQTGLKIRPAVEGDFEITLNYKIIRVEQPDAGYGSGVAMFVQTDSPGKEAATLAVNLPRKGEMRVAADRRTTDAAGKRPPNTKWKAVGDAAREGRLRLTRTETKLRYEAAIGGGEFQEVRTVEFGAEPVTTLRVVADPGGSTAPVEVVFSGLTIRSEDMSTESQRLESASSWGWAIVVAAVAVAACSTGGLVWWRFRRRQD